MNWRTDKPTAKMIVAYIRKFNTERECVIIDDFPEVLMRIEGQYYYHDLRIAVTEHIEKWADLEEDEIVTDCNDLEEEIKRYNHELWDRDTTLSDVARHFAKWGAEHTIKELEPKIKLAYGKVSMNPFDCSEAFEELLEHLKK